MMTNKIYSENKQLETGAAKFRVRLNSYFSSWHGEKYLGNKKGEFPATAQKSEASIIQKASSTQNSVSLQLS